MTTECDIAGKEEPDLPATTTVRKIFERNYNNVIGKDF